MSTSYDIDGINRSRQQDASASPPDQTTSEDIRQFLQQIETLLQELEARDDAPGADAQASAGAARSGGPGAGPATGGASPASGNAQPTQSPVGSDDAATTSASGPSVTSAGSGPNEIRITNTTSAPMTLGKFQNGQSTTDPSASITLQPGQTGTMRYNNGEAGFVARADSAGTFQSSASRLEYEADADGKQRYPDISYIDGRNASISLSDHSGLDKGDNKSIAAGAPAGAVTTDAAGNKTVAGYYDGSTAIMRSGADYLQSRLGTGGAYLHPNDDQLSAGNNPMSSTQSHVLYASFGDA